MEKLFNLIAIEYLNNIIGTTEQDGGCVFLLYISATEYSITIVYKRGEKRKNV